MADHPTTFKKLAIRAAENAEAARQASAEAEAHAAICKEIAERHAADFANYIDERRPRHAPSIITNKAKITIGQLESSIDVEVECEDSYKVTAINEDFYGSLSPDTYTQDAMLDKVLRFIEENVR